MNNKTYEVETMENEIHKCTACSCEYTDDEGGVQGDFGILPMSFCPTCLACMLDMAEQLNPREWIGLTDEDWNSTPYDTEFRAGAEWAESKLMEKNSE